MSYILEALRKSERDRQAAQAPSLPNVLHEPPPRRPVWLLWLLVALLVLNGAGLAWLFLSGRGKPAAPVAVSVPTQVPAPVAHAPPVVPAAAPPAGQLAAADAAPDGAIVLNAAPPVAPAPKAPPIPPKPAAAEPKPKPVQHAAPLAHPARPRPAAPSHKAAAPPLEDEAWADEEDEDVGEEAPPPAPKQKRKVEPPSGAPHVARYAYRPRPLAEPEPAAMEDPAPAKDLDPLPMFGSMPVEFRERVPPFRINIFAYSPQPAERFAIIDMHKYRVGDELPGGAALLEIRADCLVLELDGERFRYPRP
jgi:general secretion pathway protein B